ncbi:MAG: hypothetical protein IKC20_00745 [Clostridia bacterium]|nr:hypothetical protein [Clostridia bacterium]MBR4051369.1 hypothetical protein [Clostridia bacterium]
MKRKLIIIFTLCLTAGVICGAMIKADNRSEKNISDSENSAVGYKYTVKEFNGNVAVFSFGSTYPIEVLECPLKSLPDDEAQKLTAGIDIETEEELQQLIEAYD